ncbi:MAG: hypothetical protein B0D92_02525 [Spirochaeta sp. LUC14_002_19_P3]|nr:MAG: hypothetical protein B0D92_02525 [Spirochaeta sp. LUC14_002_19_P3]
MNSAKFKFAVYISILALLAGSIILFTACASKNDENLQLQSQNRSLEGDIAYIRNGEQLYYIDLATDSETKSIAVFYPGSTESGEWPKITFEMVKDILIVKGGSVAAARPVDESGQNKEFYKKVIKLLAQDGIDMPAPTLRKGQYIYNTDGLVREIVENPTNIIYKKNFWVIANDTDTGASVYMHTKDGSILRNFLPEKGYLIVPKKVAEPILRIDIGNRTYFPVREEPSVAQLAIDKFFKTNINPGTFKKPRISVRVYKASANGGSLFVLQKNKAETFYVFSHRMIIFADTFNSRITTDGLEEYPNYVLW